MTTGANDASIATLQFPQVQQTTTNGILWSYHKQGTINGIPVREQDKDLNITTQAQLNNAFQLNQSIVVWTGWLSPQYPQDLQKYQHIKQLEADNKCIILEHQKQYSSSKNAYLVLLTYANIEFVLNDRYSFYKQDLIND